MKVIKRKDDLRMRSKFRMIVLYSKLTFLKVVFHDLKSMICHLNEELKTTEQDQTHQNKSKAENTLFIMFTVGLTFVFRKSNTLRHEWDIWPQNGWQLFQEVRVISKKLNTRTSEQKKKEFEGLNITVLNCCSHVNLKLWKTRL